MSPKELQEFLHETKAEISGFGTAWVVVDDSQLVENLERKSQEDNVFLVGVLPSYGSNIRNSDALRDTVVSQILVLEKTDYSELSDDEFIEVFERTYQLARKVAERLQSVIDGGCFSAYQFSVLEDLEIVPIWKKSQCNGWSINFSF